MRRLVYLLSTIFLLTACEEKKPQPPKKPALCSPQQIKKEVKKLPTDGKKQIYTYLKSEIQKSKKRGDEAYRLHHYFDALKAYELVNFYEDSSVISQKKLHYIKKKIDFYAALHYKQATKALKRRELHKALKELNLVMMYNPDYKDTKELYQKLNNNRDIKIELNNLKTSLEFKTINFQGSYKELLSIEQDMQHLVQYDYKNTVAIDAKKLLQKETKKIVDSGLAAYKAKRYIEAKKAFLKVLKLDAKNTTAQNYLRKIALIQNKTNNLTTAQQKLQEQKYEEAIKYAQKVLLLDKKNKEARNIIHKARKEAIKKLLQDGEEYYNKKNLEAARECFNALLRIQKDNKDALLYNSKIIQQLHTIKSLQ
jgi:tetratricopeptide (TPR) repeat protein